MFTMPGLSSSTMSSSVKSWKTPASASIPKLISPLMVMTSGSRFFTSRVRRSVVASDELLTLTLMLGWVFSNSFAFAVNQSAASALYWKKSKVTVPAVLLPQPARPAVNATAHTVVSVRYTIPLNLPTLVVESGFILDSFVSFLHYGAAASLPHHRYWKS